MRDADVREALRKRLYRDHDGDADTLIVEEMGVWSGSVRIDVAVINGELSGYELKSDRDTLERLPAQADIYSKVFDRMTLVVGARHASKARGMVPEWWGCTVARMRKGRVVLVPERPAQSNPAPSPFVIAQLLWKDEAISILDKHGLARGWRSKPAAAIFHRLASELPFRVLVEHVRTTLRARERWLRQSGSRHLDVTVHAVLDPSRQSARTKGAGRNCVNLSVAPTMGQPPASAKTYDATSVTQQLGAHGDAVGSRGSNSMEDEKSVGESVLGVDWIAPGNTRRRQVRGDGRVVAEINSIRKTVRGKRSPKTQLGALDLMRPNRKP